MAQPDVGFTEIGIGKADPKDPYGNPTISLQSFATANVSEVEINEVSSTPIRDGRPWHTGYKKRFPLLSFWCLVAVIALCIASVIILVVSDNKDVDSWCTGYIKVHHREHKVQMTVSVWISLISFLAGQALAIVFTQGLAVSWWVGAMKGKTLNQLHHDWAAGQSLVTAVSKPKLISWVCVATVAHAVFAAMGTVLQKASTTTTVPSEYFANMTTTLAGALPAGYSGIIAAAGHDVGGVRILTPHFIEVIQNYTSKAVISIDVDGCPATSNVSCTTILTGVGFQYSCSAGTKTLAQPLTDVDNAAVEPIQTVFETAFNWDYFTPWQIGMSALWKDKTDRAGDVIATRNCKLVPAVVEYPVNISAGVVTLQQARSNVHWTAAPASTQEKRLLVDTVVRTLPRPDLDSEMDEYYQLSPGQNSTLGGVGFAFESLFTSSITTAYDVTNLFGGDVAVTGSFAVPFAVFHHGTTSDAMVENTYSSPMDQLLANMREIMFRSSVAVVQHNITDLVWKTADSSVEQLPQIQTDHVPRLTATHGGTYRMYHTVYQTSWVPLAISIALMALIICCILPLFYGYWRLGRQVSLSPLEMAKALHQPANVDFNGEKQHISILDVNVAAQRGERLVGSNYPSEDLVNMLGDMKVRYGEVEPNVMGMGPVEHTGVLHGGTVYR